MTHFPFLGYMEKFAVLSSLLIIISVGSGVALAIERQPNSDYRARRLVLVDKTKGGYVVLFALPEAEGPNDLCGYRPNDNFFYLTGWTDEPGIYLPEEKLGVRIEDIFYVDTTGKLIDLTQSLPHTAEDVEHTMAGK